MAKWRNRITGTGEEAPDQLMANPQNHRLHPKEQQKIMAGVLDEIGWIQEVIVNTTTGHLIDGHLRVEIAMREEEPAIPVTYVELTEDEERKALATLDPITSMAEQDQEMLNEIIGDIHSVGNQQVLEFLSKLYEAPPDPEGDKEAARQTLQERFLVPPFSVLDTKQGYWKERKNAWIGLGIRSEIGRGENLTYAASAQPPHVYEFKNAVEREIGRTMGWHEFAEKHPEQITLTGTSIFDPVLTEVTYSWFCPPGGHILDPFAGGSVRGVVAAWSGYDYTGIELRPEQVQANKNNWAEIEPLKDRGKNKEAIPAPTVEQHEGLQVVRDDKVQGGTKRRALQNHLQSQPETEFVYATPAFGFAQVALAHAAEDIGKRATIFTAERKHLHHRTKAAQEAGAKIVPVPHGYLSNVTSKAKEYAEANGAHYIEFGVDNEAFIEAMADVARNLDIDPPSEVWAVAGSGVLTRALQRAWPDAEHHAVQIGATPDIGVAHLHQAPEKFENKAKRKPPFPSCPEYDAKAWQFIESQASPGALFWNVAGEAEIGETRPGQPRWIADDSTNLDAHLETEEQADLVFSCPPYADLEVYSEEPGDISNMDYSEFLPAYRKIIERACARLKPNRFAVWVIGEVRGKDGKYRGLVPDTIQAFEDAGMAYYDEIILLTNVGSNAIRAGRMFEGSRKVAKAHQNALVFTNADDPDKAVGHTIKGLSGAIAEHFNHHRQVFEAMQQVLVFTNGNPKQATEEIGAPTMVDMEAGILETIETGNQEENDDGEIDD